MQAHPKPWKWRRTYTNYKECIIRDANGEFILSVENQEVAMHIVKCVNALGENVKDPIEYINTMNELVRQGGLAKNELETLKKELIRHKELLELAERSIHTTNGGAMHSPEPPQVSIDTVVRDIYKDIHVLNNDVRGDIGKLEHLMNTFKSTHSLDYVNALYDVYCEYAKSNDPIYNVVMHNNGDGSLSMFKRSEFQSNFGEIMNLLMWIEQNKRIALNNHLRDVAENSYTRISDTRESVLQCLIDIRSGNHKQDVIADRVIRILDKNTILVGFTMALVATDIIFHIIQFFSK